MFFINGINGYVLQLLNDVTGKLDAKKACKEALKIHKKYLLKVGNSSRVHAFSLGFPGISCLHPKTA